MLSWYACHSQSPSILSSGSLARPCKIEGRRFPPIHLLNEIHRNASLSEPALDTYHTDINKHTLSYNDIFT